MAWKHRPNARALEQITEIIRSDADPSTLFFVGKQGLHVSTSDAGHTYVAVSHHESLGEVKLHPHSSSIIMASSLTKRCSSSKVDGECFKQLYVSRNRGEDWVKVANYVVQFEWAHTLPRAAADGLPADSIFATVLREQSGPQSFGKWDEGVDFVLSVDGFMTSKVLVPRGNRFLFTDKFLAVAQVQPVAADGSSQGTNGASAMQIVEGSNGQKLAVNLLLSPNGGRTFRASHMPFGMKQHSYTILDTSEDSVFLHVNHEGEDARWGNVYLSNSQGTGFSLSLPYNRRDENGKCDFEKLQSMEGIYVANFIHNAGDIEKWDREQKQGSDMGQEGEGGKKASSSKRSGRKPRPKEDIRTVITFDKGAVWEYLKAPEKTSTGEPLVCPKAPKGGSEHCSLHLHGVTDVFGPFYSADSAIGVLIATGCVGPSLCLRESDVNTYLSRDGGHEWFEIAAGSHIYEIGDHGGLIVMAFDEKPVTEVVYSWNEGLTWETYKFTDRPVLVDNIMIEPDAVSQTFVVYGTRKTANGKLEGVAFHLNFEGLHTRACQGADRPGLDGSDYELWSPSATDAQDGCLLGHEVQYVRRRRDAVCFNGEKMERNHEVRHCQCTEKDYECDFGYTREVDGGPCVRDMSVHLNYTEMAPFPCPAGTNFEVSNGYRKVAGDTCLGGVQHAMVWVPCPNTAWHNRVSNGGWVVLMLVVMLVSALCMVQCAFGGGGKGGVGKGSSGLGGVGSSMGSRRASVVAQAIGVGRAVVGMAQWAAAGAIALLFRQGGSSGGGFRGLAGRDAGSASWTGSAGAGAQYRQVEGAGRRTDGVGGPALEEGENDDSFGFDEEAGLGEGGALQEEEDILGLDRHSHAAGDRRPLASSSDGPVPDAIPGPRQFGAKAARP